MSSSAQQQEPTTTLSFLEENRSWVKFVPALLVWPIWLYTMIRGDNLWSEVFVEYYPMTIAMIAGSFIAGSTPLGGGIVAFPVSVLLLKFNPVQARDISVLIQSVGMNAAAYLLFVTKPHLLNPELIITFTLTGTIGIIIGLIIEPQPKIINVLYTLLVFEFGIVFFYTNVLNPAAKNTQNSEASCRHGPFGNGSLAFYAGRAIMLVFGLAGGLITSTIGSGSDIFLFLFGLYGWNIIYPNKRYSENVFTASSVVVMGAVSLATSMLRVLNGGFDDKTLFTWGAMIPIVVVGAPLGSIVITPKALPYLRAMFYFLSIFQFIMFASLKIKKQTGQWIAIAVTTVVVLLLLAFHYHKFNDDDCDSSSGSGNKMLSTAHTTAHAKDSDVEKGSNEDDMIEPVEQQDI